MIYLGLEMDGKQAAAAEACRGKSSAVVFYGGREPPAYSLPCRAEYRGWADIIMYKYFYRLLEEITLDTAVILDEVMRVQKRNDLTYNCLLHYIRKAGECTVFQYFPVIDCRENFCILADMDSCGRTRGRNFAALGKTGARVIRRDYKVVEIPVDISDADRDSYRQRKEAVFSRQVKDPESLPRQMAIVAGDIKARQIDRRQTYVARNARFKAGNVFTYGNAPADSTIIDPPASAVAMHDHLAMMQQPTIRYLTAGLPVDVYYIGFYRGIAGEMEVVYDSQE